MIASKAVTSGSREYANMLQYACLINLSKLEGINKINMGP